MDEKMLVVGLLMFVFGIAGLLGRWAEARQWRRKGDHDYRNRMESGGRLYQVKRER